MKKEHKRLEEEINNLQRELYKLPEGKLILCANGNGSCKWFRSDGHTKKYIKRNNRELAEQLAYKKYLMLRLEELCHEKMAIEFYLRHHSQGISKSSQLISDSSEYRELLSSRFTPLDQQLNNWIHAPYEKNKKYPQQLIHKTPTGEYVRSKSEAIIYTFLYMNKIPFRYECALELGNATFYPDFTILHPRTREVKYWENFGMMDKREYAKSTYEKLDMYHLYGIIPNVNLITTYETKDHPLGVDEIEKIIEHYFM